jgi:mono/diheme cytochrome c family protein
MRATNAPLPLRVAAALSIAVGGTAAGAAVAHSPGHDPIRAQYAMQNGIPPEYRGLHNPLRLTAQNLAAGSRLYKENCALCHGPTGKGDGEAAAQLDPAPPSLAELYTMPMMGMGHGSSGHQMMGRMMGHQSSMAMGGSMGGVSLDGYVMWAISEGGEPVGSAMPAFKDALSEHQRWQIILFMANGFRVNTPG